MLWVYHWATLKCMNFGVRATWVGVLPWLISDGQFCVGLGPAGGLGLGTCGRPIWKEVIPDKGSFVSKDTEMTVDGRNEAWGKEASFEAGPGFSRETEQIACIYIIYKYK